MATFSKKILRTVISACTFFFLMASYYVVQPTRAPILFAHFEQNSFQWFYLLNAILTLLGVLFYNYLVSKYSRLLFIRILFVVIIFCFLAFWSAFHIWLPIRAELLPQAHLQWEKLFGVTCVLNLIAMLYHLFLGVYILFFTAIFWSLNHEIHTTEEAKITYPYISFGGQLGVMFGSYITGHAQISPYNISYICVIGLIVCWFFIEILHYYRISNSTQSTEKQFPITAITKDFSTLLQHKYVLCIAILVILGTYAITICDYQYKILMKTQIPQLKEQTIFMAGNNFRMAIGNSVMALIITPILLHILGPALSIVFFPLAIIITSLFFLGGSDIYFMAWLAITVQCLNYTLYQVGKEIFYTLTDSATKYKIKALCDIFIYRFGEALGSISITLYLLFFSLIPGLSVIVICLAPIWLGTIGKIGKEYYLKKQSNSMDQLN